MADSSHLMIILILISTKIDCLQIRTLNSGNVDARITPAIWRYYTKLYQHGLTSVTGTSLVFGVKSCADASLLLSSSLDLVNTKFYEINYGCSGNQDICIHVDDGLRAYQDVRNPPITSCTEIRIFWVSWENGRLMTGRGTEVGQNKLIVWQDPLGGHTIRGIGVMSTWGSSAGWVFPFSEFGKSILFCQRLEGQMITNTGVSVLNTSDVHCAYMCLATGCSVYAHNTSNVCHLLTSDEFLQYTISSSWNIYIGCWNA